jgi:hypothetical protein
MAYFGHADAPGGIRFGGGGAGGLKFSSVTGKHTVTVRT